MQTDKDVCPILTGDLQLQRENEQCGQQFVQKLNIMMYGRRNYHLQIGVSDGEGHPDTPGVGHLDTQWWIQGSSLGSVELPFLQ